MATTTTADLTASPVLSPDPFPEIRRFSVSEYHRMAEAGILAPRERVELLDGVIYQMSPSLPPHSGAANNVAEIFQDLRGRPPRWHVRVQSPLALPGDNEPEPDVALVRRPRLAEYSRRHPGPADVFLLFEIALSSLESDRRFKAPRYARAGIGEFWILKLVENVVEVYRQPDQAAGRYLVTSRAAAGEMLSLATVPGVAVPVADLLGAAGTDAPSGGPGSDSAPERTA